MLRSLLSAGYEVDIIVSNLSERGISSKNIEERLSKRYSGANFIVRKHPSLLDKSLAGTKEYKLYKLYKLFLFLDILTFSRYKVSNYKLLPYNIRNIIKSSLHSKHYDIVYCNYLYTFGNFMKKKKIEVVTDIHDYQYRRIENDVIPSSSWIESKLYSLFFKKSELNTLKKIDKILSISPIESKMIEKDIRHPNVYTAPATADDPNSIDALKYTYDLSFIGSNSDANRDSIIWFLDNCFSKIVEKNSRVKLLIQGRIVRNKLVKENEILKKYIGRNIIVKDYVQDLSEVYIATKIIIAPIVKGSGMKIKVIEALSYKKPVIGTDIAFEGINVENRKNVIVANKSIEFIDAVNLLINDKTLLKILKNNAYKLFKAEHSFNASVALIKKVIK